MNRVGWENLVFDIFLFERARFPLLRESIHSVLTISIPYSFRKSSISPLKESNPFLTVFLRCPCVFEAVAEVNAKAKSWVAGVKRRFNKMTLGEA